MFFLRKKEVNIVEDGWLDGMLETHCHLLPGVDDGVRSLEESRALLQVMQSVGIRQFIFTPHIHGRYPKNSSLTLPGQFQSYLSELSMPSYRIMLAAEYMIDDRFESHLDEPLLTMGASRFVLIELSFAGAQMGYLDSIRSLRASGGKPLLAHPERYLYMSMREYEPLKELGVAFQLNLFSLTGMYGDAVLRRARKLLVEGVYDFVGTDTHRIEKFQSVVQQAFLPRNYRPLLEKLKGNNQQLLAQ